MLPRFRHSGFLVGPARTKAAGSEAATSMVVDGDGGVASTTVPVPQGVGHDLKSLASTKCTASAYVENIEI